MPRVRLAAAARDDLRDIRVYSKAAFGPQVATDYLRRLRSVFALLRDRPYAGAAEDDLGEGVRSFAHRSYRIYYRVAAAEIVIVRILHHAREPRRALRDRT